MVFTKNAITLSPGLDCLILIQNGQPLTFREVLNLWSTNPNFRKFYWQTLIEHGGEGCFWEHPRLNQQTVDLPYDYVERPAQE